MKKILLGLLLVGSSLVAQVTPSEMQLIKSVVPGSKVIDADKTPIDGLYIVLLDNKKFLYVYPYKKIIFFGELMTNRGKNISVYLKDNMIKNNTSDADKLAEIVKNTKGIDAMKERALQVMYNNGNDDYALYLFTDPDCPFCKRVEAFLTKVDADVRYIFTPIKKLHPQAEIKARQLISDPQNIKNILEKIRTDKKLQLKIKAESQAQLEGMVEVAKMLHFSSTPMILVLDKKSKEIIDFIQGADMPKLQKYTKGKKDEK